MLVRRHDKVLFVLRSHTGWMDGHYALPAGHVEENESFIQAAQRELEEEVGLKAARDQFRHAVTLHEFKPDIHEVRIGVCFEVSGWQGEAVNAEPEKHDEIRWFSLDELPQKLTPSTRQALAAIKSGETYVEFGWS
ncbi:MAG TPA: NUDIX domain-containing protein [Candidatus Saccharimonadales bacterium]|nr:NUDIX domain-containing protein [Candidatus Saccharimonadales bacterium]